MAGATAPNTFRFPLSAFRFPLSAFRFPLSAYVTRYPSPFFAVSPPIVAFPRQAYVAQNRAKCVVFQQHRHLRRLLRSIKRIAAEASNRFRESHDFALESLLTICFKDILFQLAGDAGLPEQPPHWPEIVPAAAPATL